MSKEEEPVWIDGTSWGKYLAYRLAALGMIVGGTGNEFSWTKGGRQWAEAILISAVREEDEAA